MLIKRRNAVYFGFFAAAAASLLPWTTLLAEMLGPIALFGLVLMLLFLAGGFGILKEVWGSRFWAFLAPIITGFLLAIMLAGSFRGSTESPGSDVILMFGLPLFFSVICLAITVVYGAEDSDTV